MRKGFAALSLLIGLGIAAAIGLLLIKHEKINLGATSVFQIFQGGTGTSTTPTRGQILIGRDDGAGVYTFVSSSSLSGTGITTSSAVTILNFPVWATANSLQGTSTISMIIAGENTIFSGPITATNFNASGTGQFWNTLFFTAATGTSATSTLSTNGFTFLNATSSGQLTAATGSFSSNVTTTGLYFSNATGSARLSISTVSSSFMLFSSATGSISFTLPLITTALSSNGGIGVENTTATLSFFASSTQFVLNPEQCNIDFVLEIASSTSQTQEDDWLHVFKATSTITKLFSEQKRAGDTATFNLIWNSTSTIGNRSEASSTARHLFAGAGVQGNVTSTKATSTDIYPDLVAFASTTINAGSVMRLVTNLASTTQWGITVCYIESP